MKSYRMSCENCGGNFITKSLSHIKNQKINCPYCNSIYFIEAKHSKIGAQLEADFERDHYYESKEITKAEWEFRNKQEERKNANKYLIAFLGFMITFFLLAGLFLVVDKNTNVSMTTDANSLEGENYVVVKKKLEDMGFKNIKVEKVKDLKFGILASKGEVKEVTINGENDFKKDDSFDKKSKVAIYYHEFEK